MLGSTRIAVASLMVMLALPGSVGAAAAQSDGVEPDRADWTAISIESRAMFVALPPGWTRVPGASIVDASSSNGDWLALGLEQGEVATGSALDRADVWLLSIEDAFGEAPEVVEVQTDAGTIARVDLTLPDVVEPVRSFYLYDGCADGGAVAVFRGTDPARRTEWDGIASGIEPCTSEAAAPGQAPSEAEVPLAFKPITLKGKGDKVARFKIPEDVAAIAIVKAKGSGNFALWTLDASGEETDLLVNEIGAYSGTVLFDEEEGEHSVAFEVTASGAWTIRIEPASQARKWPTGKSLKGKGDDVILLSPPSSGLASTDIRHTGKANFAIWAYATDGTDLLVNEIGRYSGEALLPDGTLLLAITADGSWTMSAPR